MWASEGYLHMPIRNVSSANLRQPARGNSLFLYSIAPHFSLEFRIGRGLKGTLSERLHKTRETYATKHINS